MTWSTYDMKRDGHAEWLVRTCEKVIVGMREFGLPTESSDGYLSVTVPTLYAQANQLNKPKNVVPGTLKPSGVIDFLD